MGKRVQGKVGCRSTHRPTEDGVRPPVLSVLQRWHSRHTDAAQGRGGLGYEDDRAAVDSRKGLPGRRPGSQSADGREGARETGGRTTRLFVISSTGCTSQCMHGKYVTINTANHKPVDGCRCTY